MSEQAASNLVVCPHCMGEIEWPLPVPPLYTLGMAKALLLAPTMGSLYTLLWRHQAILEPPRYAHGDHGRRYRLLTAGEIRLLRDRIRLTQARFERYFFGQFL